ncbi:MAG TPA: response regulator [Polyangia bacterium]|nr:response regulator [Polyangia bacterium]
MTRKKRPGPTGEAGDALAPGAPLAIEVGAIIHDLRNVFSAIRGFATVIGEDLPAGDPARDDVDQVLKAVDRGVAVSHRLSELHARFSIAPTPPGDVSAPVDGDLEQSAPWALHRPRRSASILVVEDDELLRTMIVRVLRRDGYTTLEAGNSIEAEEQALAHGLAVDLLLVDVGLPVVGGPQLVERLKQRWPAVKVLLMSGFGRTALAERGVRPGPGLLEKPFSPPALLERLEALLAPGRS